MAAVLLLVAVVTSALGLYVSRVYAEAKRDDIRNAELPTDQRMTLASIHELGKSTATLLYERATSQENNQQLESIHPLKQNLSTETDAWRHDTRSAFRPDIAVAALDAFVARDRQATILHQSGDLSICAASSSESCREREAAIVSCPGLNALLGQCFSEGKDPKWRVIAAAGSAFLVAAAPIKESRQEQDQSPAVGVAAVAMELNDDWINARNEPAAGRAAAGRGQAAAIVPVKQIVFAAAA
ncbi:MAG: hypothetical protein U1E76_12070 [Planctomycetota bacterium]